MRFGKFAILAAVAASAGSVWGGSIEDIGTAPDPSAAIQIYVNAPDRSSLEVEHAYVRRMEELGTPELADSQAKDVVARDPKDSVGWAAIAESNAKRGRMVEALNAISNVGGPTRDDPIVLGASGRLIAWYQNFGTSVQIDPVVKQKMDDLSRQLADKPAFADAMSKAKQAYSQQPVQQQTAAVPNAAAGNSTPIPQSSPVVQSAPVAQAPQNAPVAAPQQQVAQQPIYNPGGAPVQVNPGPYGGTPVNQAPPPQTVTSADVNVPQQREYVSGDAVYQGAPYAASAYTGTVTYGAPAYVAEPVYVPSTTYYYDSYPYYYGPDVYIYGGYGRGYYRGFHDFHDFHDHRFDRGVTVRGDVHFDNHGDGGHFDGHGGGGGGATHGGGGGGGSSSHGGGGGGGGGHGR